ncbi:CPA4 [Lepeophtheirus salmonis]|uniref:CPA4 n=1 Tax=Lepeophtheirus salmonis TaxID=72036 RepID=A0A7R8H461_LEPSM|nr:CPA4 [Lepeophtheirus salmonis]CAF2853638.1 CPA4 [Lepeophtheirus salmonis]
MVMNSPEMTLDFGEKPVPTSLTPIVEGLTQTGIGDSIGMRVDAAELFLYPYGYAVGAFTDNHAELEELGQQAASALNAVHGSKFGVINAAAFWPGAGAADDWYAGVLGSRFVYTIELRKGEGNIFDLPTEEITPSGEELWEGIKVMLNKAHEVSLE